MGNNPREDDKRLSERKVLLDAIKKIENEVSIESIFLHKQWNRLEAAIGSQKVKNKNRWRMFFDIRYYSAIQIGIVGVFIFVLGGIAGTEYPFSTIAKKNTLYEESQVTRSGEEIFSSKEKPLVILIKDKDPISRYQEVIDSALEVEMMVYMKKTINQYKIIISGFDSRNKLQIGVRSVVGLDENVNGDVEVIIEHE